MEEKYRKIIDDRADAYILDDSEECDDHSGITVAKLIQLLEAIEDKNKEVVIEIRQYNKAYLVAYTAIINEDYLAQGWEAVRIGTSLPDDMRIMVVKQ